MLPAAIKMVIFMKRIRKKILSIFIAALLCMASICQFNAETIYIIDGYSYTIINNESVSLYAWDYSSDVLTVPDSFSGRSMVAIASRAFKNDSNLTAIDFSSAKSLSTIGIESFFNSGLSQKVIIPTSVTAIGERAFQNCQYLPEVEILANVTTIPTQCFNRCDSLSVVTLPDSLDSIEGFAFANCPKLERIDIPASVTSISPVAFSNDPNLILGVWYGSYAHQYAIDNNINYTLLDGVKLGDVDGDGDITITDATAIQRYLAELETLDAIHLYAADANEDKEVDIADATAIQMAVAKIPTGHPIGRVITK